MRIVEPNIKSLDGRFKPAAIAAFDCFSHVFNNRISAFYLAGSAHRGDFIEGVSDLDFRCLTLSAPTSGQLNELKQYRRELGLQLGYRFDLVAVSLQQLDSKPGTQFSISRDALLLWGDAYHPTVKLPSSGLELAQFMSRNLDHQLAEAISALTSPDINPGDYARISRWLAKIGLRLAVSITIADGQPYEPSIVKLISQAEDHLPKLTMQINELDRIYHAPADTKAELELTLKAIKPIITAAEAKNVLPSKD